MTDRSPAPDAGGYAELHAHSAFSFLDGASQPEDLVHEAARLGLRGLALTDHDGLYGVVRFAQAARDGGLPTVFGAELHLPDPDGVLDPPTGPPDPRATHLLVLARGPDGYRALSTAIADAHLATGTKGAARYRLPELAAAAAGQWLVLTGCRKGAVRHALERQVRRDPTARLDLPAARTELDRLVALFGRENVAVEITDVGDPWDSDRNDALATIAADAGLPLVATGNVHHATPADADLRALLRRSAGRAQPVWQHGALEYDPASRQVRWRGEPVPQLQASAADPSAGDDSSPRPPSGGGGSAVMGNFP